MNKVITFYFILIIFLYVLIFNWYYDEMKYIFNETYNPSALRVNKKDNFDLFLLCLTYPTSYCLNRLHCTDEEIKNLNKNFNLHGLWPNYYDSSYPSYCSKNNLDIGYINKNKNDFLINWGTFNNKLEFSFFAHEWYKHGTCSNSTYINDSKSYFENALSLEEEYDILGCLTKSNITPDNNKTYNINIIKDGIKKCYPYSFNLNCDKSNDKYYMSEIHFYYTKELKHMKYLYKDNCGDNIIIPLL
jgi:ribonuclease I